MARLPRYVLPGQPQHIIQGGNNRQVIFASDTDFQFFRDAMVSAAAQHGLAIHARNAQAATGANSDWITPHLQYLKIARSAAARLGGYRALFKAAIGKNELAQIRDCTHKGWALGGDKFKQEIETRAQRQASSKGVERPRVAEAEHGSRV